MMIDIDGPVVMRVLIVEAVSERQRWLKSLYRDHAWVLAQSAARAVRLLDAYPFDLISLNYKLAGPGDGERVACAVQKSQNLGAPVLVHSVDSFRVGRLTELLPNAVCVPIRKILKTNARVRRVREELRYGVPANWRALVSGRPDVLVPTPHSYGGATAQAAGGPTDVGPTLTVEEICQRYPNSCVLLADLRMGSNLQTLSGAVLFVGSDREEAYRKAAELRARRFTVICTGEAPAFTDLFL